MCIPRMVANPPASHKDTQHHNDAHSQASGSLLVVFWNLLHSRENVLIMPEHDLGTQYCLNTTDVLSGLQPCVTVPSKEAF